MKTFFYIGLLYICLSLLMLSCTKTDPEPTCIEVEVVGPDCENGWYILKLERENIDRCPEYRGMLQSEYVTTNNLPDVHKVPGLKIGVALDVLEEHSPLCLAVTVVYPAVSIKQVCEKDTPAVN